MERQPITDLVGKMLPALPVTDQLANRKRQVAG